MLERWSRRVATVCVLGMFAAAGAEPASAQELHPHPDPKIKDWNQYRGNAARSGVSGFRPVRREPEEAWRVEVPGKVVSNIVTWDGAVFVLVRKKDQTTVRVYDAETGETAGARRLRTDGAGELAVRNGTLVVQQTGMLSFHGYRKGSFRMPVRHESDYRRPPLVHDGVVFTIDSRGRVVSSEKDRDGPTGTSKQASGDLSVQLVQGRPTQVFPTIADHPSYVGKWLRFSRTVEPMPVRGRRVSDYIPYLSIHRLENGGKRGGWLVVSQWGVATKDGSAYGVMFRDYESTFNVLDVNSEVVVKDGRAFGWTEDGELISVELDGSRTLLERRGRPDGFRGYRLSAAQDVLYLGNSAVEMNGGRVLWCAKGLHPVSPMIPSGDGRVVFLQGEDTLIGLTEPEGAATGPGASAGGGGGDGATHRLDVALTDDLEAPPAGDGVLLRDGRFLAGKVEVLESGGVKVTGADGKSAEHPAGAVALAVQAGQAVGPRSAYHAHRVWRAVVRRACAEELESLVRRCMTERLLTEGRRVLERARAYGLPSERVESLGSRASGLQENPNADSKEKRIRESEVELDVDLAKRFVAGATWLEERGLQRAAAALLVDAEPLAHGKVDWAAHAARLAPAHYAPPSGKSKGEMWAQWAKALLPSGAELMTATDERLAPFRLGEWDPSGIVAFATENVLLLSKAHDPEVVGACLQRGETAVASLETLLYEGMEVPDGEPLVVLLHADRKSYLAERTPTGGAPEWSAGYYSPMERLSRFYVPRDSGSSDPLGRSLYSTLAHELTHHWVDVRWAGGERCTPLTPGYWIVEGIAQFIGDQAADSEPHTVVLDNPNVTSIDAFAQAAAKGASLPLSDFVDLRQLEFAGLSDEANIEVQLRNTLSGRVLSQRVLFYEQAAALTWFLMNRRGPEGRERVRRYLWSHYTNQTPTGGWAPLGFASVKEMADEFSKFVTELAGRPARVNPGSAIAAGPKELEPAKPGITSGGASAKKDEPKKAGFEVGDEVWVRFGQEFWGGNITGQKDDKFWVLFGHPSGSKKILVPASDLRPR